MFVPLALTQSILHLFLNGNLVIFHTRASKMGVYLRLLHVGIRHVIRWCFRVIRTYVNLA